MTRPSPDRKPAQPPAPSPQPQPGARWKCVCAYDGGGFSGWQSQPGGDAVQDVVERRLAAMVGRPVRIHGSGRTDAGVHAWGQVFHFDADWRHGPEKLKAALAAGLPRTIQIREIRKARPVFHARFSAVGKIYRYEIFLGDPDPFSRPFVWARSPDLDVKAMAAAARVLAGRHDFRAFSANNGAARSDTTRTLRRLAVSRRGARVRIEAEADGFLYKMVRSLVGGLVAVGEHRLEVDDLRRVLSGVSRTHEVATAPAQGLFLYRVLYPRTLRPVRQQEPAGEDFSE